MLERITVQPQSQKEFEYQNPSIRIGEGKLGPIHLIIKNNNLLALKVIHKAKVDKPKRILHLKSEKYICNMLCFLHKKYMEQIIIKELKVEVVEEIVY